MRIPYKYRPSFGFILLVFIWIFVAVFFLWGYSEPDLDVAWRVLHRLKGQEAVTVSADEAAAVRRAAVEHPELRLEMTPEGKAFRRPREEPQVAREERQGESE